MPCLAFGQSLEECRQAAECNYPLIRQYGLIEKTTSITLANIQKAWLPQVSATAQTTLQSDVGMGRYGIFGNDAVHHAGQRIGVGRVAGKDGRVAYEPLGVYGQREHQQTAVGALFLGASKLCLGGGMLASLEIEVCQVVEYHAVGDVEERVGAGAQMALQLILERIERGGSGIHLALCGHIAKAAGEQFHGGRVFLHDTQRFPLRRRIYGPHYQRGKRGVDAAFAPSFAAQELVYLQFTDGLQAYVFRAHFPGIGVLDGVDINQAARLSLGFIVTVACGIDFTARLDFGPELVNVGAHLFAVLAARVDGKERGLSGDERTLLHQVGQSPSDLNDFIAAQVGQIAGREHHPRMDAAEHIAERLLYLVVRERPAMFGAVSCDGGKVHAAKIRHVFHRCGYYKGLRRGRPQPRLLRFNRLHDAGVEIRAKFYGKKFLALKLG